jgi:hypothetical protein
MAKLADAADLKSAGAKSPVGVRFPLPAPAQPIPRNEKMLSGAKRGGFVSEQLRRAGLLRQELAARNLCLRALQRKLSRE